MAETYEVDGITYTKSNKRMVYHPDFHENHKKEFSLRDIVYLCSSYEAMKKIDLALALGRTTGAIQHKACLLRKEGTFDYYKSLADKVL